MPKKITLGKINFANNLPFVLIAGPCQLESEAHAMFMSEKLTEIAQKLGIGFVYKTSFDKANRTSLKGKRGIGLSQAIPIFTKIKETFSCPILTDVHKEEQCEEVATIVDIIQIPAFLCRQTDLLIAAAKTGKVINIKKGQFLAPQDIAKSAEKVALSGNDNILLTDRGTSFGYNTLISDMRGIKIMADTGYPVIIDATHSIQQPGGLGSASGGNREFAPVIASAAVAVGVAGVFMEVHDDPDNAPSDGPCMVKLAKLEEILQRLIAIDIIAKQYPL